MKQKEDFGKKPVRRSRSEEKEPARVYRPRTAKLTSWQPKERYEEESYHESDSSKEKRSQRPPRKDDEGNASRTSNYDKDTGYSRGKQVSRSKTNSHDESDGKKKRIVKKTNSSDTKSSGRSYEKHDDKKSYRKSDGAESRSDRRGSSRSDKPRDFKKKSFGSDDFKGKGKFSGEKKYGKTSGEGKGFKGRYGRDQEHEPQKVKKLQRKPPQIDGELKTDKDGYIRLNKYIANSGLCSRREADEYIEKGYITVNGQVVDQLGSKVMLTDEVRFKGKDLDPERKVYILLNKPKDYITTVDDPNAKRTVMDLIEGACDQRVYPVGRLDRNSTGLLLLTNDGELTKKLTHPSFMKKKVYEVGLDRSLSPEDLKTIATGIEIEEEMVKADAVEYIDPSDRSAIGMEIHSGQNRIVRKIFEKLNYKVSRLDRVYFAGLTKKNLPRGKWRFLSEKEVDMLKMNRF